MKPAPRVVQKNATDLQELSRIVAARPLGREVVQAAKRIRGAHVVEHDDGRFEVTAEEFKAKRELAHLLDGPRPLEAERGAKLQSQREMVEVATRDGHRTRINADSEAGAGRAGLLQPLRFTALSARVIPRCWEQGHDYRQGRCWWCGRLGGAHPG